MEIKSFSPISVIKWNLTSATNQIGYYCNVSFHHNSFLQHILTKPLKISWLHRYIYIYTYIHYIYIHLKMKKIVLSFSKIRVDRILTDMKPCWKVSAPSGKYIFPPSSSETTFLLLFSTLAAPLWHTNENIANEWKHFFDLKDFVLRNWRSPNCFLSFKNV